MLWIELKSSSEVDNCFCMLSSNRVEVGDATTCFHSKGINIIDVMSKNTQVCSHVFDVKKVGIHIKSIQSKGIIGTNVSK